MRVKQVDIEESAGKTIQRVFCDHADQVLIVFTDGTFALVYGWSDAEEVTVENGDFRIGDWWEHRDDLWQIGIVSQAEIDAMQQQLDCRAAKLAEERRQEYERLKAEFESA